MKLEKFIEQINLELEDEYIYTHFNLEARIWDLQDTITEEKEPEPKKIKLVQPNYLKGEKFKKCTNQLWISEKHVENQIETLEKEIEALENVLKVPQEIYDNLDDLALEAYFQNKEFKYSAEYEHYGHIVGYLHEEIFLKQNEKEIYEDFLAKANEYVQFVL